jgi:hypothetical protein
MSALLLIIPCLFGEDVDNLVAEDEKTSLMKEWEEHMSDFKASDLITFEIPARTREMFYEEIDLMPSKIRGAWFVNNDENDRLDFHILNPT